MPTVHPIIDRIAHDDAAGTERLLSFHGLIWPKVLDAVPLETQLRLLPTLRDRRAMMMEVAERASRPDGLQRLQAALALGADLNPLTDAGSVLGAALRTNAPVEALDLLLAHGADVSGANAAWTPAHDAAGSPDGLAWLKAHGADLDVPHERRGTPLQVAGNEAGSRARPSSSPTARART